MNALPQWFLIAEALIFGLLIGSFLNVCIYRIPKKMSLLGRSFCPSCNTQIPMYRNVPVLAYVSQLGKSACCKKPISIQYPLVEALTAFLSVVVLLHVDRNNLTLAHYFVWFLLFFCPLLVISIIDLHLRIIPDVISLPFIIIGVGVQIFQQWPDFFSALKISMMGIFIGGGVLLLLAEIFSRVKKTEAMGGGDIKLAAMLGAFLGWKALLFVFFASSCIALLYVIATLIARRAAADRTIPFGPFLSMAGMIYWLYGKPITDWYFLGQGLKHNPFFN